MSSVMLSLRFGCSDSVSFCDSLSVFVVMLECEPDFLCLEEEVAFRSGGAESLRLERALLRGMLADKEVSPRSVKLDSRCLEEREES